MKTQFVFINALKREITFYIGKNQNENFAVIDKGSNDDLWFHAADVSSCHVVCQVPADIDKKMMRYIVTTGALLCKNNTNKLKTMKNVNITYTKVSNIVKTDVPGCVITKDAKMISC